MDDTNPASPQLSPFSNVSQPPGSGWLGALKLDFAHQDERSFLAKRQHQGPLVIQKTLHPEGPDICHGIIVHPPGGVAGGDRLLLDVKLDNHSNVLLTTPGAGKWYKANQQVASQHINITIGQDAHMEWLPQENILFDGAKVNFLTQITLDSGAAYAGWDIVCLGRQAKGETWQEGTLRQALAIRRNGKLVWNERTYLTPQSRVMQSLMGLRGNVISGGFVVTAGAVPASIVDACRALGVSKDAQCGVTALPEIFSARYIGQSSQEARQYFERLWMLLRPWYGQREANKPRIWNT